MPASRRFIFHMSNGRYKRKAFKLSPGTIISGIDDNCLTFLILHKFSHSTPPVKGVWPDSLAFNTKYW